MPKKTRAPTQQRDLRILIWKLSQSFAHQGRLMKAYLSFVSRPYFMRVWTLQELFLAKSITVCCGGHRCSGETLHGFEDAMMSEHGNIKLGRLVKTINLRLNILSLDRLPLLRRFEIWRECLWDHHTQRGIENWSLQSKSSHSTHMGALTTQHYLSIFQAVSAAISLECADPRDRLYGLLSLVNWTGLEKPRPNYDSDVFHIALETLQLCALSIRMHIIPTSDHRYDGALDVAASTLLHCFRLTAQSNAKVFASLQQRQWNQHTDFAAEPGAIDGSSFRFEDVKSWRGMQLELIHNSLGQPEHAVLDCGVRVELRFENGIYTGDQGRLQLMLPTFARSGDWMIYAQGLGPTRLLIIRPRPDNKYDLVGQAACIDKNPHRPRFLSKEFSDTYTGDVRNYVFRIFFELEDLLALVLKAPSSEPFMDKVVASGFADHLYFASGLSYAERLVDDTPL
ncbi:hypothetical protein F4808DRAFT_214731 [Astrocystis sublimbata]|nr:hypothetical protein F4808DRAFT_214731 [Astrocystis sublimbata]